jgi:hypothetical protein
MNASGGDLVELWGEVMELVWLGNAARARDLSASRSRRGS